MELKFKPQSTHYTCVQATQAIALNSFLGTDYSDLEVIAALENGFPLDYTILNFGQEFLRARLNQSTTLEVPILEGIIAYLRQNHILPSLEMAADTYKMIANKEMQNLGEIFRKSYEKELKYLEDVLKDKDAQLFYTLYMEHLDKELFTRIKYRFEIVGKSSFEKRFSGITILSEGELVVEPYIFENLQKYNSREGILIFGINRKNLGLPAYSSLAGHFWVVDRREDDRLVLLDTNHHIYGHGQEVYVPVQLFESNTKDIRTPALVHHK